MNKILIYKTELVRPYKCYTTFEKNYIIRILLNKGWVLVLYSWVKQYKTPRFLRSGVFLKILLSSFYKIVIPVFVVTPVVTVMLFKVTGIKGNAGLIVIE